MFCRSLQVFGEASSNGDEIGSSMGSPLYGIERRRRLHVTHLITDLDIGGAERMLVKVIRATVDRAQHQVVSLTGDAPLAKEIRNEGMAVYSLGLPRSGVRIRSLLRAVRAIRAFQPDILQTWLYHADLVGTILAPLVRNPSLVWNIRCVDMDFEQYPRRTRYVVKLLSKLACVPKTIVANSAAGQFAHEAMGYRGGRWEVIPNGFDLSQFKSDQAARARLRSRLSIRTDTVLFGVVARNDPAKNYPFLLDAVMHCVKRRPNTAYYLVGPGVSALGSDVLERGLERWVRLDDARDDLLDIYNGLDCLLLSSSFGEGFPNVIGEAMSCGTPCVATDVGDVREIIGDTGFVVPRDDLSAFVDAIVSVADWPAVERRRCGAASRERIAKHYGIDYIAKRYLDLWEAMA